jgi:hypothetical protein
MDPILSHLYPVKISKSFSDSLPRWHCLHKINKKNNVVTILSVRMPHITTHFVDSYKKLELKAKTNSYGANVIFVPTQAIMSLNTNPRLEATKFRENFSNKRLARGLKHKFHWDFIRNVFLIREFLIKHVDK